MGALVRRSAVIAAMFIFALTTTSDAKLNGELANPNVPTTVQLEEKSLNRRSGPHAIQDTDTANTARVEGNAPNRRSGPYAIEETDTAIILNAEGEPISNRDLSELRIPILVYHHVREHEGWAKSTWSWKMTVSPTNFDQQMQWLTDHGYTTITLDTLVKILDGKKQGPEKPVVLTFDDNNINVLENGLNAMTSRGHIGVFYLVANRLDQPGVIGRTHIPDLLSKGMDIQSHTMSHAGLTNLSNAQATTELAESKRLLEEATGKTVQHVAYPLTMHNQRIRDLTKAAGYVTGTIMDPRPIKGTDDRMKLARIMMTDDTNLEQVLP
jgi:peptidoglycan/xylan/chitin deacetylase (PgdA/CDA1 family)